ncbi:MAG: DUF4956 domain-containing protein [Verrucomicrobiota bacterium]
MEQFFDALSSKNEILLPQVLVSLFASFILGLVLAAIYRWTHQGFSYSRTFIHTIVLSSIVITIMVMAIGNNLARGLGILGAMAFIRFRTPIRDPRDIIFLFAALAIGISAGAQVYSIAIVGTAFFGLAAFFLTYSPFGSRREFEGLLRFMLPNMDQADDQLSSIFSQFTKTADLISAREAVQGEFMEYTYQVQLIDPSFKTDLVDAVADLPESSEVSLIMQRTTVEI